MKYVIIGNSAAAIGIVKAIRRVDSGGSITLISDGPHHTYSRPLIPYLLDGKTGRERMKYRPNDFYAANRVNAVLGKRVVQSRPFQSEVLTGDVVLFPYDRLLVVTGSRPLISPHKRLGYREKQVHLPVDRRLHCHWKSLDFRYENPYNRSRTDWTEGSGGRLSPREKRHSRGFGGSCFAQYFRRGRFGNGTPAS